MKKVPALLYRVFIIAWICWVSHLLVGIKVANDDTSLKNQVSEMKQILFDLAFDVSVLQSKGDDTRTAIMNVEKNLASIEPRIRSIQKQVGTSGDPTTLRDMIEQLSKD
ncbi:MAG: hypothetical protein PHP93_07400 [Kiritimatiellales bacterium]|nr:hypothetical protein [Kiritimatiellales bacterium]